MALYAIGDLQGCHDEFVQLLDLVGFSPATDRMWLVGGRHARREGGPAPAQAGRRAAGGRGAWLTRRSA